MKEHKISWLNIPGFIPETWNPIIGCSKVSPGCENCYAEKQAHIRRFNAKTAQYKEVVVKSPHDPRYGEWNGTTAFVLSQLTKPAEWTKPRAIFVCSMGDLFHEHSDFEKIDAVFSVMSDCDQHLYILLTKRPERMAAFWKWKAEQHGIPWQPKPNVWLGITAENQEQANKRIPILLQVPAVKRFVSIEPMLGPVKLNQLIREEDGHAWVDDCLTGFKAHGAGGWYANKLDWVIVGGESGPNSRPVHPDWVRSVRDQCQEAGTPFFFKQWGEWLPMDHASDDRFLKIKKTMEVGYSYTSNTMLQVGRKAAGDLLDGQQHHAWPELSTENCQLKTAKP